MITAISKCKNLNFLALTLDWNFEVSNVSLKALSEVVKTLENLTFLKIDVSKHTKINMEGEEQFKEAVKTLGGLKHCEFNYKNILGQ